MARILCLLSLLSACPLPGPAPGPPESDGGNSPAVDAGNAPAADAGDAPAADAGALPAPDAGISPEPVCGDGQIDPDEICDDGNDQEDDDCANDCTPAAPFHAYDDIMENLMSNWHLPGMTVAVTKDERLVLVRAYGQANEETERRMMRGDRMRIASLSKPVTAVAILRLVEQGRLSLDESAFAYFDAVEPPEGTSRDLRLGDITIAHLLRHEGGWNRQISGDPMFLSVVISEALGIPGPATADDTLRYMLGQPLDFNPGTLYAYSNFGYSVLGRIIESVTGLSYEQYVQDEILTPMGIHGMEIGRSKPADRPPDEVHYHVTGRARATASVFPEDEGTVASPDGAWHQEALDSHGGWIANVADLSRFLTAVDGRPDREDLLNDSSRTTMVARPELLRWRGQAAYYGMGWSVRPVEDDATWWHSGALPGTATIFVRTWHGYTWVALANGRPHQSDGFFGDVDQALWQALQSVETWPDYDLFERAQ